ncbi:MAG: tetratricopeptide repeat protein [Myxococcales bacterium]|nr:tetratricopeptide repeat protein [Myxococcales bacterium]
MPETFNGPGGEDAALCHARMSEAFDHLISGAIDEAVRCVRDAVAYGTPPTNELRNIINSLQDHDRHDVAVELCEGLLAREPDNVAALIDLGFSLEPLGEYDRARAAYTRASEIHPSDATALNNRAFLELSCGNLDKAREDIELALGRSATEGIAHATKAEILAQQGDIAGAFESITTAVELDEEWLDSAKNSEFLAPIREAPQWSAWLAEHDSSDDL